jgi:hypothetical protein
MGPTAILVTTVAVGSIPSESVRKNFEMFREYRQVLRDGLLERLDDLKPHFERAIDSVEAELGLHPAVPAAGRVYRREKPPGIIELPKRDE